MTKTHIHRIQSCSYEVGTPLSVLTVYETGSVISQKRGATESDGGGVSGLGHVLNGYFFQLRNIWTHKLTHRTSGFSLVPTSTGGKHAFNVYHRRGGQQNIHPQSTYLFQSQNPN